MKRELDAVRRKLVSCCDELGDVSRSLELARRKPEERERVLLAVIEAQRKARTTEKSYDPRTGYARGEWLRVIEAEHAAIDAARRMGFDL